MKRLLAHLSLIIGLSGCVSFITLASEQQPYLYVLGVGQDAGYPQAGCFKPHCMPGWEHSDQRRGAVSLGLIDPAGQQKFMFEATPDFPQQFYQLQKVAPSPDYTLAGIFLSHAHIGHYSGLMFLGHEVMGASGVPVYAMPRMRKFLRKNGPWSQLVEFKNIELRALQNQQALQLGQLRVTPFLVPHRDEYSETVGFRIDGPNKSAIFIPDINKWSQWDTDLTSLIKSVDYALLDATFFGEGELPGRDMLKIPHPHVSETMQLLEPLQADERSKVWFIHFNHTNPLFNVDSAESKQVRAQGFNIAREGLRLPL